MKNLSLAILMLLLFTNMQCGKTPPPEPPTIQPNGLPLETQEGKNTFGCFWNDTLWLPEDGLSGPGIYATYNLDSGFLDMSFSNRIKYKLLNITLKLSKEGAFDFTNDYPNSVRASFVTDKIISYRNNSNVNDIKINITKFVKPQILDNKKIKGIISGNFSLKLYKLNTDGSGVDTTNSMIINKAVFDLQLN